MLETLKQFLWIGCFGFGGPMATMMMMQQLVVDKQGWLSNEEFLQGMAVCNLLPGPAATQMAIYIGYRRHGWLGGIACGLLFILPAFILMCGLCIVYFSTLTVLDFSMLFYGINVAIIAIIFTSLVKSSKLVLSNKGYWLVMLLNFGLLFVWDLVLVLLLDVLIGLVMMPRVMQKLNRYLFVVLPLEVFVVFLKMGALVYGGGMVIIPMMQYEVVNKLGWLTNQEFLVGLSFGQLTPGPIVITSVFVGYKLLGLLGAFIAAVGIFLPSFVFILGASPWLVKLQGNKGMQGVLGIVNAGVIGLIGNAMVRLLPTSIVGYQSVILVIVGSAYLMTKKGNVVVTIIVSGLVGYLWLLSGI
jgi:chromate transporter